MLTSPSRGVAYRVGPVLARGGSAEVHTVRRLPGGRAFCLKVTRHQLTWHREVSMAELVRGPRAVAVIDAFQSRSWINGQMRPVYCVLEELAPEGDLISALAAGRRYSPSIAVREVLGLLRPLAQLHAAGLSHGDLTPANVLVFAGGRLKLGDFAEVSPHRLRAGADDVRWNPHYAPRGYRGDLRDDVFFTGQVLAMLLAGSADRRLTPSEIADLPCPAPVRRVIARATGPAAGRYADAGQLRAALRRASAGGPLAAR